MLTRIPEVDAFLWQFSWNLSEASRVLQEATAALTDNRVDDATRIIAEFNERKKRPHAL